MGSYRKNANKPKLTYVLKNRKAIEGIARVFEFGETKYPDTDWREMLPLEEALQSAARHLVKFLDGEEIDEESKLSHLHHLATNALMALEIYERKKCIDD